MNPSPRHTTHHILARGSTLVEMLVGVAVGTIVLGMSMGLYLFTLRGVSAMSNYTEMDSKSQRAVDLLLREIREANLVVSYKNNSSATSLTVANTLASPPVTNTFTWNPSTSLLTWDRTGQATRTVLSGCDYWSVLFYIRVPDSTGVFYSTTDPSACKLLNMTWKCSRSNIIKKMNTESIVTAEVALRNKP